MIEKYEPNLEYSIKKIPSTHFKKMDLVLLVDTNSKINGDVVNEKIEEMILVIKQLQVECDPQLEIVISIIRFTEEAECCVEQVKITDYVYKPIVFNGIRKSYSNAYDLLNKKLSRKEFMAHKGKIAQPYILLFTDGIPDLDDNYESKLSVLLENGWFKVSNRFAVFVGEDKMDSYIARSVVSGFVSNSMENIVSLEVIVNLINPPITIGPGIRIPIHHEQDSGTLVEKINIIDNGTDELFDGFGGLGDFTPDDGFI